MKTTKSFTKNTLPGIHNRLEAKEQNNNKSNDIAVESNTERNETRKEKKTDRKNEHSITELWFQEACNWSS